MSALNLPTPSTYLKLFIQHYGAQQTDRLLVGTGVSREHVAAVATLPSHVFLTLLDNANRLLLDKDWALALGQRLNVSSHGPVGFAVLSAENLSQGLAVLCEYAPTRVPYLLWREDTSAGHYRISFRPVDEFSGNARPVSEIVLQVLQALLEAVLGPDLGTVSWHFDWARDDATTSYPHWFRGKLCFDAGWCGLELPPVLRNLPCPLHDEGSYRVSLARCRADLERVLAPADTRTRVRNLLGAHFDQVAVGRGHGAPTPQLPEIAARLHMSSRSLIRRLAQQDTSYRTLLEAQQRKVACELLSQARYRVAEVGELLGFADPANFTRAFRRWTGQSPAAYRRN